MNAPVEIQAHGIDKAAEKKKILRVFRLFEEGETFLGVKGQEAAGTRSTTRVAVDTNPVEALRCFEEIKVLFAQLSTSLLTLLAHPGALNGEERAMVKSVQEITTVSHFHLATLYGVDFGAGTRYEESVACLQHVIQSPVAMAVQAPASLVEVRAHAMFTLAMYHLAPRGQCGIARDAFEATRLLRLSYSLGFTPALTALKKLKTSNTGGDDAGAGVWREFMGGVDGEETEEEKLNGAKGAVAAAAVATIPPPMLSQALASRGPSSSNTTTSGHANILSSSSSAPVASDAVRLQSYDEEVKVR